VANLFDLVAKYFIWWRFFRFGGEKIHFSGELLRFSGDCIQFPLQNYLAFFKAFPINYRSIQK
jgi:hypothetical protein